MALPTTDIESPAVWIGCLGCYNGGSLVGDWYEAIEAEDITIADVHKNSGRSGIGCEELWCLDVEHLPVLEEMSPQAAAAWARLIEEIDEHLRPAFYAWVQANHFSIDDLPSTPDFEEAYCGEWDDFAEYAHGLADNMCLLIDAPDDLVHYFDWSSWISDIQVDFTVVDASGSGVYVFRSI